MLLQFQTLFFQKSFGGSDQKTNSNSRVKRTIIRRIVEQLEWIRFQLRSFGTTRTSQKHSDGLPVFVYNCNNIRINGQGMSKRI